MAYNGYNRSPYFHGSGQDERSQASYSDTAGGNGTYQRQPYQPMTSAPTTYVSVQTSSERTTNNYDPARYANLGGSNDGGYNARAGTNTNPGINSYHTNPRSSIDTTALGNLAYASSLGQGSRHQSASVRENSSLQPISADHNASQTAATYGESASYGLTSMTPNGYDHRRSDSRGTSNSKENINSRDSPSMQVSQYGGYSASDGYGNQQPQVFSRLDQGVQSSESHMARFDGGAAMQSARQYSAHPSRPASGQSFHARQATTNSKPTQSPHPPPQAPLQAPPPASNYTGANLRQANDETSRSDLSKQNSQPLVPPAKVKGPNSKNGSASISKPPVSRPKAKVPRNNSKQANYATANSQPGPTNSASNHHNMTPLSQPQNDQRPATNARTNGYNSGLVEQSDVQYPTTIDPNKVFNHYEYEKRQAEAAAAVKGHDSTVTEANSIASTAGGLAPSTKDQMELEMKQMIEKMRDYKAKDPTLFSQIWEQVKKRQPSNQASSQATPSMGPSTTQKTSTETNEDGQLPSLARNQLPQESDLSVEPLKVLDLGKFPAQRRRGKGNNDSSRRTSKVPNSEKIVSDTENNKTDPFPPLSPAIPLHSTNLEESSNLVNGSQSMQDAMNRFNRNLVPHRQSNSEPRPTETVYVRGVGPSPTDPATSTPETQTTGRTIWPEVDKPALAHAAKDALTSSVVNAGKMISAEEIVRILDQHPSYIGLCETLERRGFIVDRRHLARLLLAAVPGLQSGPTGQENPSMNDLVNGVDNQSKAVDNCDVLNKKDPPQSKSSRKPKRPTDFNNVQTPTDSVKIQESGGRFQFPPGSVQRYASKGHKFANQRNLTQENFVQAQAPVEVPEPTLPLPPSKKEMARKRSFGELVDLTQDLSEEDDTFRRILKARLDQEFDSNMPINSATENLNSGYDPNASKARSVSPTAAFENDLRKKLLKNLEGNKSGLSSSAVTDDEGPDVSHFRYPPLQRDLLRSENIVRRMDKRHDALRRSTYNPKTIARDVMVASGKHPSMAPLNFHLDILRKKFRHVEYNSDLSTFRWDLIDPGGPEIGALGDHDIDMNDADDEDAGFGDHGAGSLVGRPVIATTANGEAYVASDTNITQPIKAIPQRKWKVPRRSEGGIRRAIAGVLNGHQMTPQNLVSEEGMMTFSRASDDDTMATTIPLAATDQIHKTPRGRPRGSGKKAKRIVIATTNPTTNPSINPTTNPIQGPSPGQRRRGRPPGSKNKDTPRSSAPGNPMMIPTRPRPSETAALTPSGLRNAMTPSDRVAVVIGGGSSTVPDLSNEKRVPRQASTPQHKIYKCGWKGCPFELHNLETLRKHVYKHRDQFPKSPFPCLWTNCGPIVISNDDEETNQREHLQFETEAGWTQHMSGKHLEIYAWELGDGPSAHPSDAEASDYLSDSRGRKVTPVARTSGPPDPMDLSSGRSTARAYHEAHGNRTEADRARAVLEAVEAKKRATGLGIDRGGSTFVTAKMRDLVDEGPAGISKVAEEDL